MIKEGPWINCDMMEYYEFHFPADVNGGVHIITVRNPKWVKKFSNGERYIIDVTGRCSTIAPGWLLGVAVPKDKEAALNTEFWDNPRGEME